MRRLLRTAGALLLALPAAGCAVGPLLENPLLVRTSKVVPLENPVYVPQGPLAYRCLFDKCIDVVDDYFEIAYASRYDRTGTGADLTYTDTHPDGVTHTYYVTAVDTQLAESPLLGPVTK